MKSILSLLLILIVQASQANQLACLKGAPEEQLNCVQEDFKQSEIELNDVFNKIVEKLKSKQEYGNEKNFVYENMLSRLRMAQRSWIYFRAGQCEMETFSKINREYIIASQIQCHTKMNQVRTNELKEFFSQYLKVKF